jgi:hypothetical protein
MILDEFYSKLSLWIVIFLTRVCDLPKIDLTIHNYEQLAILSTLRPRHGLQTAHRCHNLLRFDALP